MSTYKEIIESVVYLTVATADDAGQPWNSPVYGAYDDNYNFFWGSHRDSQHSRNIRANGKAFIVIYDSAAPAGEGEGVYIKARAEELIDSVDIEKAHELLQARRPIQYWEVQQLQGDAPIRLYRAIPEKMWTNNGGEVSGTYIDVREEVSK